MAQRYAVIDQNGNVIETVMWSDDTADWTPPMGCITVQSDTAQVGQTYTNGVFSGTPSPTPVPQPPTPTPTGYISVCSNCGLNARFSKVPAVAVMKCFVCGSTLSSPQPVYT